jgi:hypothetical protein
MTEEDDVRPGPSSAIKRLILCNTKANKKRPSSRSVFNASDDGEKQKIKLNFFKAKRGWGQGGNEVSAFDCRFESTNRVTRGVWEKIAQNLAQHIFTSTSKVTSPNFVLLL